MSGPGRRFDPAELGGAGSADETPVSDAELAEALAVARELESLPVAEGIRPTTGFEDRVMAAIAAEPAPRLAVRPATSVRGGRVGAFLLAVRDAWGVATGGGRPLAVRAQALAFVLLVVVAAGALTTVTAVTVGSLVQRSSTPAPTVAPAPSVLPAETRPPAPTTGPTPPATSEPSETPEASETPEPGDTGGAGATAKPPATPRSTRTPRPTETPHAEGTDAPEDTPEPTGTDDHGGSGGSGGGGGGGTDGSGHG